MKTVKIIHLKLHYFSSLKTENPYFLIPQKLKFWTKMDILVKTGNFGQKMEICKFGQKFKLWSKIKIFVKNWNLG